MEIKTYSVPNRFLEDHIYRQLDEGITIIGYKGRNRTIVTMTQDAAEELMSDAIYYAMGNCDDMDDLGLVSSARFTVRALVRQGLHDYKVHYYAEREMLNKFRVEMGLEAL